MQERCWTVKRDYRWWLNLQEFSEFLAELQTQIQEIHDYADDNADVEQQRYTDQCNKRAVDKHFQVGQQVTVLIPDSTNKFLSRWQGPED